MLQVHPKIDCIGEQLDVATKSAAVEISCAKNKIETFFLSPKIVEFTQNNCDPSSQKKRLGQLLH